MAFGWTTPLQDPLKGCLQLQRHYVLFFNGLYCDTISMNMGSTDTNGASYAVCVSVLEYILALGLTSGQVDCPLFFPSYSDTLSTIPCYRRHCIRILGVDLVDSGLTLLALIVVAESTRPFPVFAHPRLREVVSQKAKLAEDGSDRMVAKLINFQSVCRRWTWFPRVRVHVKPRAPRGGGTPPPRPARTALLVGGNARPGGFKGDSVRVQVLRKVVERDVALAGSRYHHVQ